MPGGWQGEIRGFTLHYDSGKITLQQGARHTIEAAHAENVIAVLFIGGIIFVLGVRHNAILTQRY